MINWETPTPGDSVVRFGLSTNREHTVSRPGRVTLHHVEIPTPARNTNYYYSVQSGPHESATYMFRAYPTDELRVAVVADWLNVKAPLEALLRDMPHLLLTAGDNVPNHHERCGAGLKDCTKSFSALIDSQREFFRSVPFLPVPGNHDKEIRPRGGKPPAEAVYDVEATAFRKFFALPGDEWKWTFDVPEFEVRFVALDLHHISDFGTTWQACHDFHRGSPQFEWYRRLMEEARPGFVVTLQNERNAAMRAQEDGAWHELFRQGTLVVSGFGYYAERAVVDGFSYYNTCLAAPGAPYRDPKAVVFESASSYLLLTLRKGAGGMTAELKRLDGTVIDKQLFQKRQ